MKRIFAIVVMSAVGVVGLAGTAHAEKVSTVSKSRLAATCKSQGGTSYTGANGRYGCIVEHDDGTSDSVTCDPGKGCFHEKWEPVAAIVGTGSPTVTTATPVTTVASPIGSLVLR